MVDLDLVHARLVLTHVPQRSAALATMASALRPGGWLVVEEADPGLQPLLCPDEYGPEQELANRLRRGFRTLMAGRSADLALRAHAAPAAARSGLVDVGADAFFPITGAACTTLEVATVEQIRGRLVEGGIATDAEIDEHLANIAGGRRPRPRDVADDHRLGQDRTMTTPRVLVIGVDPRRYADQWDPTPIMEAIERGDRRFDEYGIAAPHGARASGRERGTHDRRAAGQRAVGVRGDRRRCPG